MDFSLRCSNFLHVLYSARMKHRATGLSNNNNHVYMAVALEAWQEVGQEGSKQASKRRKRLGDWRTHYTKDISTIKNTNFKNMLKGPSVGKTFTTTVRQVTPFYDWQTSFPHSAVTANAAAAEPKAVDERKRGGGARVCLSFKRVCAIKFTFTFAFACAARLLRCLAIFIWRTKVCNNFFYQAQHRLPKRTRV